VRNVERQHPFTLLTYPCDSLHALEVQQPPATLFQNHHLSILSASVSNTPSLCFHQPSRQSQVTWDHSRIYSRRTPQTIHLQPAQLLPLANLTQLSISTSRVLPNHYGRLRLSQIYRGETLDRETLGRRGMRMREIAQTHRIARDDRMRTGE